MTSILTNSAAMAALQTLQTVNSDLGRTQRQVSSGLRVETASDNVAYWSIATTMKSDNMANSAASDALGVGQAKVQVAGAGLDQITDLVSEFRSKLVTASETSVDRSQVQQDLDELKKQLVATATSASFSGVNWLNTDSADNLLTLSSLPDSVVSSFIRNSDGTVQVGKTEIDTADTSVFNVGGGGALQKDIRSLGDIGGFRNTDGTYRDSQGTETWQMTGPVTLDDDDSISFDISVDGNTATPVTITKSTIDSALGTTDGTISSAYNYSRVLTKALSDAGLSSKVGTTYSSGSPQSFGFESLEAAASNSIESSVAVSGAAIDLTPAPTPASDAGGLLGTASSDPGTYAATAFTFSGPFQIYHDVQFSFDLTLPGGEPQKFVVNRDTVDAVLGTTDGMVNSASDLAAILNAAKDPSGNSLQEDGVDLSASGSSVEMQIDPAKYPDKGARSWFTIDNIQDNVDGADFDILDVDITDPDTDMADYVDGLDKMLQRVIKGGATIGAAQTRLDMQADFGQDLMDNISEGVSRLVDTDMEEASARLAAEQTQQQLAVQSLQIANSSAQNVLSLFS